MIFTLNATWKQEINNLVRFCKFLQCILYCRISRCAYIWSGCNGKIIKTTANMWTCLWLDSLLRAANEAGGILSLELLEYHRNHGEWGEQFFSFFIFAKSMLRILLCTICHRKKNDELCILCIEKHNQLLCTHTQANVWEKSNNIQWFYINRLFVDYDYLAAYLSSPYKFMWWFQSVQRVTAFSLSHVVLAYYFFFVGFNFDI